MLATFARMDRIGYWCTRLAVELFRFMPFWLLYRLSDGLAFLLYRIVGYRRQVVWDNLRRSFPEKTEAELAPIARESYRSMTDVMLETMKSFTLSVPEIERRCVSINPELVNRYLEKGQSVIISGGHYGNWEYSGVAVPPCLHGTTVIVYKPISNRYTDAFVNHSRVRTNMILVPMDATFATMRQHEKEKLATAYILLADQSPSNRKAAHWVEFLGQDTPSLPGVDVLARKFRYPVLFYLIRRVRRGFYEVEYSEVWPNPAEAAEAEISQAFAQTMEAAIRRQPEPWLWSHKRWKMTR